MPGNLILKYYSIQSDIFSSSSFRFCLYRYLKIERRPFNVREWPKYAVVVTIKLQIASQSTSLITNFIMPCHTRSCIVIESTVPFMVHPQEELLLIWKSSFSSISTRVMELLNISARLEIYISLLSCTKWNLSKTRKDNS